MVAFECKQCKTIFVGGYVNEYEEHFCTEKCYKNYCNINNFPISMDKLTKIKLPF